MEIKEFTNKNITKVFSTISRKKDISPVELCNIHFKMGEYLAYQIIDELDLIEIEFNHVQGIKKGFDIAEKNNIVIFSLMRAGLYVSEGIRTVFPESNFVLYNEEKDLNQIDLNNKTIIIVDSVINTGKSLEKIIKLVREYKLKKIIVATIVLQKKASFLADKYKEVSFYTMRISDNMYVGKGKTDTGNRLFNTI